MTRIRSAGILFTAVVFGAPPSARAETELAADESSRTTCEAVRVDLSSIGIDVPATVPNLGERRARRRAFASDEVDALVVCRSEPDLIEVFYPDGSRLGAFAFDVSAQDDIAVAPVYVSERIRSERFVADVPVAIPFAPALWWLGVGADAFFSPGGVAPLALVRLDLGYRFHRHGSVDAFASIQPYMRGLNADGLETRLRLDQYGVGLSYHPLVRPRVDIALGARAAAVRLGVSGTGSAQAGDFTAQRDAVWSAFPAGRVALRVGLSQMIWMNVHGELGAILPRVVVSGGNAEFGSIGEFAASTGLSVEAHFR
jgi:hypothetical protein